MRDFPEVSGSALHHLAVGARDVPRVADFYERAFDLPRLRVQRDEGGIRAVWLGLGGGAVLMIERVDESRARVDGRSSGPFLLAFRVEGELRGVAEGRLEALGAPIESRTEYTSYARDPEGNRVAVSAYPLPSRDESVERGEKR